MVCPHCTLDIRGKLNVIDIFVVRSLKLNICSRYNKISNMSAQSAVCRSGHNFHITSAKCFLPKRYAENTAFFPKTSSWKYSVFSQNVKLKIQGFFPKRYVENTAFFPKTLRRKYSVFSQNVTQKIQRFFRSFRVHVSAFSTHKIILLCSKLF